MTSHEDGQPPVRRRTATRAAVWLERAYEQHGLAVACYAYHLTGDREEAERLTAAAFEAAYQLRLQGRRIRHVRVRLLRFLHESAPILPRDRRGESVRRLPEHDARSLTALRGELWRMPLDQQQALVLRRWCGLRPGQVSCVLGLSRRAGRAALRDAERAIALAPNDSERHRRAATAAVGASMVFVGVQVRAGGSKALASAVPGFTGAGATAAGAGSVPVVAGAAGKLAVAVALAAGTVGVGATVAHQMAAPSSAHASHHSTTGPAGESPAHHRTSGPHHSSGSSSASKPLRGHTSRRRSGAKKPTHPSTPTHPTQPTAPSEPGNPTDPTTPDTPSHPAHPAHPTHPTHPAHPTHPTHPAHPAHPAKPSKPGKPAKADKPADTRPVDRAGRGFSPSVLIHVT